MKLSVAMITYNHEKYIEQAIESILAQRVDFEYEIIIGEDFSTDGTRAVVTELHRRYPDRIRILFRDRNVGVNRNFAETIQACQGEFVAFLEGDDYWTATDKLQKQVDFLDAHPECAISCGRARPVYETGAQNFDIKWDIFPSRPAGTYAVEDILKVNFVMTCTAVLRRKFIPQFPEWFYEMKLGDWPLCAMVARYGAIELMDAVMAAYRVHPGGVWSSLSQGTRSEEGLRMLRALDKEFQYKYADAVREAIASMYLGLASSSRSMGRRIETARHLVSYIRNGGWRRPGSARFIAGMLTFEIVGSWYKVFSRTDSAKQG